MIAVVLATCSLMQYLLAHAPAVTLLVERTAAAPPPKRWIAVVIALVLLIAITAVSCINPKRGHRD